MKVHMRNHLRGTGTVVLDHIIVGFRVRYVREDGRKHGARNEREHTAELGCFGRSQVPDFDAVTPWGDEDVAAG